MGRATAGVTEGGVPWASSGQCRTCGSPAGRPFRDLDLTTGRHVADHPCSADLYRGGFTAPDVDRRRTLRRVAGPAEDLRIITDYARVG